MNAQRRRSGFTFWELMIVLGIIAFLACVLLMYLQRTRRRSSKLGCTNFQKQISIAFRSWGLDYNDKFPWQISVTNGGTLELTESGVAYVHFLAASNDLNTPKVLVCPEANRPAASDWGALRNNHVTYFVGVTADSLRPQSILCGDDNFAMRGIEPKRGNFEVWSNSPITWMSQRHGKSGNLAFADGSVQSVATSKLPQTLVASGLATNRLILP